MGEQEFLGKESLETLRRDRRITLRWILGR
jgi:hypothetical protein